MAGIVRFGRWCFAVVAALIVAGCSSDSATVDEGPSGYALRVTVSGLAGSGFVLHSSLGDDLAIPSNGTYAFATRATQGTAYAVTIGVQPTSPWQTCDVASGTGTIGSSDVDVAVACTTNRYALGVTVSGLTGSGLVLHAGFGAGEDLSITGNGPFAFVGRPESGATFAVAVGTQPSSPAQTCAVANGAVTVQDADVSLTVTCDTNTYGISGTIDGLTAGGLVLTSSVGPEDLVVPVGSTAFAFTGRAPSGTPYAISVTTQPTNLTCTVANGTGSMPAADVTDVAVTCSSVIQAWNAPTTWGGLWQDEAAMVQHAHFDGSGIVSDKGPTFAMAGGAAPTPRAIGGFPAPVGTRFAGGPFPDEAVNYQAQSAGALDRTGDMLACAVVKPARNRPQDKWSQPIFAKGVAEGAREIADSGWVLMQSHESWSFHYGYRDGNGDARHYFASVPNLFADQDFFGELDPPLPVPPEVQPNPSFIVLCGGRSGNSIVIAANSWNAMSGLSLRMDRLQDDQTQPSLFPPPYTGDPATAVPATIGGFHAPSAQLGLTAEADHAYEGLVFETAVWNEPATPANVQEKMNAFLGVAAGSVYVRNREAMVADPTGALHGAWQHGPRLDPAKGQLFGLQSWNRVSYWIDGVDTFPHPMIFPAGENLDLWTPDAGVGGAPTVVPDLTVLSPGDARNPAQLVTLPAGASLALALDQAITAPGVPPATPHPHDRATWDATGPIQGQLWLRPDSVGTLRVQKTDPAPGEGAACTVLGGGVTCEQQDVLLDSLTSAQWSRVSLNGSFTADAEVDGSGVTVNKGTLVLTNPGDDAISFYAWGVQLTQLGGGGDLGAFDPGVLMYDWSASNDREGVDGPWFTLDVLKLDPVPGSTELTGFCLGATATMPAGLPWSAPFANARTVVSWVNDPGSPVRRVRLYVKGADGSPQAGNLCVDVNLGTPTCAALPASFSDGNAHTVKACVSAAGETRVFADSSATPLATGTVPALPNLSGGTVLVGNGDARAAAGLTPWHGYVSRAFVCRDTGNAADCR
jgi:hypothetical protein